MPVDGPVVRPPDDRETEPASPKPASDHVTAGEWKSLPRRSAEGAKAGNVNP